MHKQNEQDDIIWANSVLGGRLSCPHLCFPVGENNTPSLLILQQNKTNVNKAISICKHKRKCP